MRGCCFWALALAATLGGWSSVEAAERPRCEGHGPWVLVELRATAWTEAQREGVLADLARALAPQGIDVCTAAVPGGEPPLATVAVELAADEKAVVDIEVRDAVTKKRVRRDVDLAPIPPDGRELAVAIEADELLRASWAEVALDTARARAIEAQRNVVRSVGDVLAPARVRAGGGFGARAAGELYTGGAALVGADGFGRLPLGGRFGLELAAGVRASPSVRAAHGEVDALAAGGSLGLDLGLASGRSTSLGLGVGLAASWLEFRADADPGASAARFASLLLVARLRVAGRLALGRSAHLVAGIDGGGALHGVRATDAGAVVVGATGLALGATLGIETP
jgi:hypothetical protein